ncbi:hypothetical protein V6N13_037578 [Hibiscus sabdariffa]|uniref:C2H2-type domain-containing protein n=1 Tax=Hibiscus sabdariffa TaxID=183260 RepID=A0ABR2S596_9ROSI
MAASRDGNMHGDQSNLIACRICDRVFTSRKDLFDHIEVHLLMDESETKRQLLLSHMSSTSHPPAPPTQQQDWMRPRLSSALSRTGHFPSTLPPREINTNPFSIGTNARTVDNQQSTVGPLPVSFQSTGNNSNPTLPRPREISSTPLSIGTNARTLDQQSTVRPLPVSFHLTGNNSNPTPPRPREININPFSIGTNVRTLYRQSTVGPLFVSVQSAENNPNPTLPRPREINTNPFSIGTNGRTSDQQSAVRPLPVSFQSTVNNSYPTPLRPREIYINPFSIGANARNLNQQLSVAVAPLPVSFQSTGIRNNSIPTQSTLVSTVPQTMTVQQSRVELFTRPFLHQLEARLLIDGMAAIVDRQIDANAGAQEELVDVTLKL